MRNETLPARGHERHRAERARRRRLRERSERAQGAASCSTTARPPTRSCEHLVELARQSKIPVVGVTETEPPGKTYPGLDAERSSTPSRRRWPARIRERRRTRPRHASRSAAAPCWPTSSFAIDAGEFIGVLGPNGAGKTTLMRAMLGLLPPSARHDPRARPTRRGAAIPPSAICRRCARCCRTLRLRGRDFVASVAARPSLGPAVARRRRPQRCRRGARRWSARATWPSGRWPRCRAASGSGCCWRRR